MTATPTILCLASYFKGSLFMEECQRQGCHVILITEQKLSEEAWPRTAINEFYLMPDLAQQPDITHAVSFLARTRAIDCIVALDDYDVETAAAGAAVLALSRSSRAQARSFAARYSSRDGIDAHVTVISNSYGSILTARVTNAAVTASP